MTEFFPTDLLTECDDNTIILSRSHSTSNSTTARTNSWENWLAQEKRRFSDESIGSNWKGASGISNIFRKDTMDLEDDEEDIEEVTVDDDVEELRKEVEHSVNLSEKLEQSKSVAEYILNCHPETEIIPDNCIEDILQWFYS